MDEPLSRGLPFELADIWRRSALHAKDGERTLFAPLEASFPSLTLETKTEEPILTIPPLDINENLPNTQDAEHVHTDNASPSSELWDTGQQPLADDTANVWNLELNLDSPLERPRIGTWEGFEKNSGFSSLRTHYLSEGGPSAFDALLAKQSGSSNGVLPKGIMLRALCNLSLGRASVFFQWDEKKANFIRTLDDVPMSGYSPAVCDSLLKHLMDYATLYRSLRVSCISIRRKRRTQPCTGAFYGCVNDVLDAVEEHITTHLPRVGSVLQLHALTSPSDTLLSTVDKIANAISAAQTDEAAISALSDHIHETVSVDSSFGRVLRAILERTSMPWLERLATDFGLIEDPAGLGDPKPDFEGSATMPHYQDDERGGFVGVEDAKMVRGAKNSLRILRDTLSQDLVDKTAQQLFRATCGSGFVGRPSEATGLDENVSSDTGTGRDSGLGEFETFAWSDEACQQSALAHIDARISGPPSVLARTDDSVRNAVLGFFDISDCAIDQGARLVPTISPIDRIRPALSMQANHLNRTVLRQLFTNQLFHHLRIQHAYHLLHSGDFVTRLSTALFSAETQSAERKRGTVPTGDTMGLRLGARTGQRWPPASSELRLTLMDVLTEAYKTDFPSFIENKTSKKLPGGLSFSIRELPEREIERVMDPSSIYALDFLRLQYMAPAPLDAILTPGAMGIYDSILRQLLRILRAVHVSTALTRTVSHRMRMHSTTASSPASRSLAYQVHSITTTLFSHMMDLGIAVPWQNLMKRLAAIESGLTAAADQQTTPVGLDALKQTHTRCLETMRERLFLRRKQEKISEAVEAVLSAVLQSAGLLENEEDGGIKEALAGIGHAMRELLKLLKSAVDKPPKPRRAADTKGMIDGVDDEDDNSVEVLRSLLIRLDWNVFYSDDGSGYV